MEMFLGIDGGGSGTRAVLVSADGCVWGEGVSGSSNYHNLGMAAATANLAAAVSRAWDSSGFPERKADGAFLGSAGLKSSADIARLTAAAEGAGIANIGTIVVANDLHNALTGGLEGRPGIALIAGTGANCLGRDGTGKSFMCGGWGWLLGDAGGGFGLALAALQSAVQAADGRQPPTRLLPEALAFFGVSEPDELSARFYVEKWTPDEVAAFAPVVMRLAREGDETAMAILRDGACALAGLVAGVVRALSFPERREVVILGGCGRSGDPYQLLVEEAIRSVCPGMTITPPKCSPTHGAALNALRVAGISPLPALTFAKFTPIKSP